MKSRLFGKKADDFKQFKTKIFFRTILLMIISILCISFLYNFILRGNFANCVVHVYQKVFRLEYGAALNLYQRTFRNYIEWVYVGAMVITFAAVFRIYLNWFANYFMEINKGIDILLEEREEEAALSPELASIEKKINTIKHTLVKRKLDAELAEQRKNDLIVYLAHDLKTPLASVIGYLNLLHDEGQISGELREKYLAISLDKAQRLEDLINEFFEIARFNLSHITLQYSRINLMRLLEMILYEFKPMLNEKKLSCNLDIEDGIMLKCDADKIQRVFDNLLKNAIIYSYEGTEITISVTREGDMVSLVFKNCGDTIPADKLDRIFEQFYRLDAARGTGNGGAGLGLAIAKQIVELHQGTITAKSEKETTAFEVTLPFCE